MFTASYYLKLPPTARQPTFPDNLPRRRPSPSPAILTANTHNNGTQVHAINAHLLRSCLSLVVFCTHETTHLRILLIGMVFRSGMMENVDDRTLSPA